MYPPHSHPLPPYPPQALNSNPRPPNNVIRPPNYPQNFNSPSRPPNNSIRASNSSFRGGFNSNGSTGRPPSNSARVNGHGAMNNPIRSQGFNNSSQFHGGSRAPNNSARSTVNNNGKRPLHTQSKPLQSTSRPQNLAPPRDFSKEQENEEDGGPEEGEVSDPDGDEDGDGDEDKLGQSSGRGGTQENVSDTSISVGGGGSHSGKLESGDSGFLAKGDYNRIDEKDGAKRNGGNGSYASRRSRSPPSRDRTSDRNARYEGGGYYPGRRDYNSTSGSRYNSNHDQSYHSDHYLYSRASPEDEEGDINPRKRGRDEEEGEELERTVRMKYESVKEDGEESSPTHGRRHSHERRAPNPASGYGTQPRYDLTQGYGGYLGGKSAMSEDHPLHPKNRNKPIEEFTPLTREMEKEREREEKSRGEEDGTEKHKERGNPALKITQDSEASAPAHHISIKFSSAPHPPPKPTGHSSQLFDPNFDPHANFPPPPVPLNIPPPAVPQPPLAPPPIPPMMPNILPPPPSNFENLKPPPPPAGFGGIQPPPPPPGSFPQVQVPPKILNPPPQPHHFPPGAQPPPPPPQMLHPPLAPNHLQPPQPPLHAPVHPNLSREVAMQQHDAKSGFDSSQTASGNLIRQKSQQSVRNLVEPKWISLKSPKFLKPEENSASLDNVELGSLAGLDAGKVSTTFSALAPKKRKFMDPSEKPPRPEKKLFYGSSSVKNYQLLDKLGEGTFGVVWKAIRLAGTTSGKEGEKVKNGDLVALKKIISHKDEDGVPITAIREIKLLKALDHPNVVEIVDVAFHDDEKNSNGPGSVYMVFPYMDHDLAGLLENPSVKLTVPQVKFYSKQLLEGTLYLHKNRILHRDLKAANLLIDNQGNLKIGDFGLARSIQDPLKRPRMPYTTEVVTRWYRAPEVLMKDSCYGPPVDMWGVGCIIGEMLWRRPIFQGDSDHGQLKLIFDMCGSATEENFPGFVKWSDSQGIVWPERSRIIQQRFFDNGAEVADLLDKILVLDKDKRMDAEKALDHPWFWKDPLPARNPEGYASSHEYDRIKKSDKPVAEQMKDFLAKSKAPNRPEPPQNPAHPSNHHQSQPPIPPPNERPPPGPPMFASAQPSSNLAPPTSLNHPLPNHQNLLPPSGPPIGHPQAPIFIAPPPPQFSHQPLNIGGPSQQASRPPPPAQHHPNDRSFGGYPYDGGDVQRDNYDSRRREGGDSKGDYRRPNPIQNHFGGDRDFNSRGAGGRDRHLTEYERRNGNGDRSQGNSTGRGDYRRPSQPPPQNGGDILPY